MDSQPGTVLAARLKQLMGDDISAADLARASDLTRGAISKLLNSKSTDVRGESLEKLAKALGTTVDFLQGRTADPSPRDGEPWPQYALEVLAKMRQLDSAQNYTLLVTARALVKESDALYRLSALDLLQSLADQSGRGEELDRLMELLGRIETGRRRRGRGRGRGQLDTEEGEEPAPAE